MSLEHAFDLWDWTTVLGLIVVGLVMGMALLPYIWPDRQAAGRAFPTLITGVVVFAMFAMFFLFLTFFRFTSGMDRIVAAKTIGTGVEAAVFGVSMVVGLRIRSPRSSTTNLDDIAALLGEIRGMAVSASHNAELAATAASAADDRVITQSERALDERKRTQTREETRAADLKVTTDDTRERVVDIQERVPQREKAG